MTRRLRARRLEAGALASDEKLKVSFTLDAYGAPVDVEKYERTDAHSMVEEVSNPPPPEPVDMGSGVEADKAVDAARQYFGCTPHC